MFIFGKSVYRAHPLRGTNGNAPLKIEADHLTNRFCSAEDWHRKIKGISGVTDVYAVPTFPHAGTAPRARRRN